MSELLLSKRSEDASTVTLGWTPPAAAQGYVFLRADGTRLSSTLDGSRSTVKVAKSNLPVTVRALRTDSEGVYPSVAPPPPPPTAWPHGGVGIWRTGNALPPGPERYDVVIVAGWQADRAAALPSTTKALLYTSDVSCDMRQSGADYFYGVSGPDAISNGWALKDTSGAVVHNSRYANSVMADPELPAYQNRWADNVIAFCASHNLDGIQIDDVDGVRRHYFTENVAKYQSDGAWQDAHAYFHQRVIPKLRAAGLFVVSNTAGPDSFLTRIASLTDAVMLERWTSTSAVQAVNAGDAIAMPLVFASPDSLRAQFKTVDRGDGVFLYEPAGGGDPYGSWCS